MSYALVFDQTVSTYQDKSSALRDFAAVVGSNARAKLFAIAGERSYLDITPRLVRHELAYA